MDFTVQKEPDSEIRQSFPIRGRVFGWYFRLEELPTGYWQVKGRDRYGHTVTKIGDNPDDVLAGAETEAQGLSQDTSWG